MPSVQFHVHPQEGLMDDPLFIKVSGLNAGQTVTFAALLQEGKVVLTSHAYYQADDKGCVDISKDPALGGSYTGIEPEGLLWGMTPTDQRKGVHLSKCDVTQPFIIRVSLLNGHVLANTVEHHSCNDALHVGFTDIKRFYMSPTVQRQEVRDGALRGTLFYPNIGSSQHPGVLDLYGTPGGLVEHRAALLASRGFTTLALAYFAFEDLPRRYQEFPLDYFEEGVDWLHDHSRVSPGGVGIIGLSKGAELAMLTSTISSKVKAVVSISGASVNYIFPLTYKGKKIPAIEANIPEMERTPHAFKFCPWPEQKQVDECSIPVERATHSQFLFIHGTDDQLYNPKHSLVLADRLRQAGLQNYELHFYPKAGHVLEPPYTPLCSILWHWVHEDYFHLGGQIKPHAEAQVDMWHKVLSFLKKNLPPQEGVSAGNPEASTSHGARTINLNPRNLNTIKRSMSIYNLQRFRSYARLIFH